MASKRGGRPRDSPSVPTNGVGRQVNNLLNTLRGEQFRHQQNLLRSRANATPSLQGKPTLPLQQIFGTAADDGYADTIAPVQPAPFREPGQPGHRRDLRPPVTLVEGVPTYAYPNGAVPGPSPPKSWTPLFEGDETNEPSWRANAFHVLFGDLNVPVWLTEESCAMRPLSHLCAQVILDASQEVNDLAEVAKYIPSHVRRDLVRWSAMHKPLSSARLYALCGEAGHVHGELLIVGPRGSLRGEALKKGREQEQPVVLERGEGQGRGGADDSWDDHDSWDTPTDVPPSLTTLGLLSSPLSSSLLSSLPPTLTHLALLALPRHAPIHRLPYICPLLEILDLSFNKWLSSGAGPSNGTLSQVEWKRLGHLRVLGLRDCGVRNDIVKRINANRWTDVEVVGVDHNGFDGLGNSRLVNQH